MVQPVQLAFQQQIQALKTQHDEFVANLKQQQSVAVAAAAAAVGQLAPSEPEVKGGNQSSMTAPPGGYLWHFAKEPLLNCYGFLSLFLNQ